MKTLVLHSSQCKSCGYCVNSCPKQALSLTGEINIKGYKTPIVDKDSCVRCGICYTVCPDYVFEIKEEV